MSLHDAVGINCEKGATTENQGPGVEYIYMTIPLLCSKKEALIFWNLLYLFCSKLITPSEVIFC